MLREACGSSCMQSCIFYSIAIITYYERVANEPLNGGTNIFVAQKFMSTNVHIGLFAS
jgi:hypothetical protein